MSDFSLSMCVFCVSHYFRRGLKLGHLLRHDSLPHTHSHSRLLDQAAKHAFHTNFSPTQRAQTAVISLSKALVELWLISYISMMLSFFPDLKHKHLQSDA